MPRAGLDPARVTLAAADLVDRDGADALSLARLAADLGVAPPSLYKHVGGLDDLVRRVAVLTAERLGDALAESAVGRSGRDALVALAGAYRSFAGEHPGTYALAQTAPLFGANEGHVRAANRSIEVISAALVGYGVPEDARIDAIRAVRASLHGFVDLERRGGFGLPDSVDRSFGVLVDALDAALVRLAAPSDSTFTG
jgi:AcrR family transcriptional regulator